MSPRESFPDMDDDRKQTNGVITFTERQEQEGFKQADTGRYTACAMKS